MWWWLKARRCCCQKSQEIGCVCEWVECVCVCPGCSETHDRKLLVSGAQQQQRGGDAWKNINNILRPAV
jgi:hypothetical protein